MGNILDLATELPSVEVSSSVQLSENKNSIWFLLILFVIVCIVIVIVVNKIDKDEQFNQNNLYR